MKKFQSWNMNFHNSYKNIGNLYVHFYSQLIIFWIEILSFGFENINLKFKYQFLNQINLFEFKLKNHIQIKKFEIHIMF